MNFFEHQRKAQLNTRKMIIYLALAVTSLLAITHSLLFLTIKYYQNSQTQFDNYTVPPYLLNDYLNSELFWLVNAGILGVVFFASFYKWSQLRVGGHAIADHLGGRLVSVNTKDFLERRLLNVVQEMSIASGLPVPPVYILDDDAINAFAAGHTSADAVVGITRGALEQLDRDQLQGVIAHEFSHIFHGDSKINLNIIAILHGILVLGLIGYYLMRAASYSRGRSAAAGFVIGIGLIILGYGGVFFGNLIKASISRQREYLADASAVQYTRNPYGIANALKVIGHSSFGGGIMHNAHVDEVTHMLFAEGKPFFFNMWATHPPLEQRIRRVEPRWDGKYLAPKYQNRSVSVADVNREDKAHREQQKREKFANVIAGTAVLGAIDNIGQIDNEQVGYAQDIIHQIPDAITTGLSTHQGAQNILLAMVIAQTDMEQLDSGAKKQVEGLKQKYRDIIKQLMGCPDQLRLPIVDLAIATMKTGSKEDFKAFMPLLDLYVSIDGKINMFEWCLHRLVQNQLNTFYNGPPVILNHKPLRKVMGDVSIVMSMLVQLDNMNDPETVLKKVGVNFNLPGLSYVPANRLTADMFDMAVDRISMLKPLKKPQVIKACAWLITHDNKVKINEVELLRALAAIWHCPMPPIKV